MPHSAMTADTASNEVSVDQRAQAPRARRRIERAHDEPSYVLHAHPWKESSLILDVFSRHHGRVALVAKGAKRPTSQLRTVLLGFQPFAASWSGRGDVRTLVRADWSGGVAPLSGLPLLCAFYFNELLVRLLAREDAHEALFDAYHEAVVRLGTEAHGNAAGLEPVLRNFEIGLLRELGHLPLLDRESQTEAPVQPHVFYSVDPETGVQQVSGEPPQAASDVYLGEQLLAIEASDWSQAGTARAAKTLMRQLLHYHLGTQPLRTRQLLIELHEL